MKTTFFQTMEELFILVLSGLTGKNLCASQEGQRPPRIDPRCGLGPNLNACLWPILTRQPIPHFESELVWRNPDDPRQIKLAIAEGFNGLHTVRTINALIDLGVGAALGLIAGNRVLHLFSRLCLGKSRSDQILERVELLVAVSALDSTKLADSNGR